MLPLMTLCHEKQNLVGQTRPPSGGLSTVVLSDTNLLSTTQGRLGSGDATNALVSIATSGGAAIDRT